MNIDGENLIRAKYEMLSFEESNRMFAITEKTQKSFDYKCKLIDEEDNKIGDEEFSYYYSFTNFDGKHAFVKVSDKMWSIIDIDGKQLQKLPDMVNIEIDEVRAQMAQAGVQGIEHVLLSADAGSDFHDVWPGSDRRCCESD